MVLQKQMITWLVAWDDLGLDSLANLTELESQFVLASLRDDKARDQRKIIQRNMVVRAAINDHRNYEIWEIAIDPDVTENDLRRCFSKNLQAIKSAIRGKGARLW